MVYSVLEYCMHNNIDMTQSVGAWCKEKKKIFELNILKFKQLATHNQIQTTRQALLQVMFNLLSINKLFNLLLYTPNEQSQFILSFIQFHILTPLYLNDFCAREVLSAGTTYLLLVLVGYE